VSVIAPIIHRHPVPGSSPAHAIRDHHFFGRCACLTAATHSSQSCSNSSCSALSSAQNWLGWVFGDHDLACFNAIKAFGLVISKGECSTTGHTHGAGKPRAVINFVSTAFAP
jgi:hypothetical protein